MDELTIKGTPYEFSDFCLMVVRKAVNFRVAVSTGRTVYPDFDNPNKTWEDYDPRPEDSSVHAEVTTTTGVKGALKIHAYKLADNRTHLVFGYVKDPDKKMAEFIDLLYLELSRLGQLADFDRSEKDKAIPAEWESKVKQPWLRDAIKMWRDGYSSSDIGRKHKKSSRTVTNRLSELRPLLGEDVVPYHKGK